MSLYHGSTHNWGKALISDLIKTQTNTCLWVLKTSQVPCSLYQCVISSPGVLNIISWQWPVMKFMYLPVIKICIVWIVTLSHGIWHIPSRCKTNRELNIIIICRSRTEM